jgi:hypothetical protein
MSTTPGPEDWAQQPPPQAGGFPPPPPPAPQYQPSQAHGVLPKSLDISVKLWIAAAAISLVHSILTIVNTNALDAVGGTVTGIGSVIFQVILVAVWLFFVWQMRTGQNWARIVLTVLGAINLLIGVIALFALGVLFSIGGLGVLEFLFSLASLATIAAAIVYQFKADANPYFVGR